MLTLNIAKQFKTIETINLQTQNDQSNDVQMVVLEKNKKKYIHVVIRRADSMHQIHFIQKSFTSKG